MRENPLLVVSDYVKIPMHIRKITQRLTVAMDAMFLNGLDIIVSVSGGLNFTTV